jgi:hypothetical protein
VQARRCTAPRLAFLSFVVVLAACGSSGSTDNSSNDFARVVSEAVCAAAAPSSDSPDKTLPGDVCACVGAKVAAEYKREDFDALSEGDASEVLGNALSECVGSP